MSDAPARRGPARKTASRISRPSAAGLGVVAIALGLHAAGAASAAGPAPGARVVIDDFENASSWEAHPADGVRLTVGSGAGVHGRALRLDFAFSGGGYAVVRRAVDLDLPENYRLRFAIRGECRPNDLELKLIDASGENVWWHNRRGFTFPAHWESLSTRSRQITFAWGPAGGGELRHVAAIEIAVTAGSGGTGTVWIDDFTLEALPPPDATPARPDARASSARAGRPPALALDDDPATSWASAANDRRPSLVLDLGGEREFGGLTIDWVAGRHPADYAVEVSDDGAAWRALRTVRGGNGGRDDLDLPESEARRLRVRALGGVPAGGIAIAGVAIQPLAWGESPNRFFEAVAKQAPRGSYPRGMSGEQVLWTVIGAPGDREEALLSEDGMLETGKGRFSIEPFLHDGRRLRGWGDVRISQRLAEGRVPLPTVDWRADSVELTISPFAVDAPGQSAIWMRYTVRNAGPDRFRGSLHLALRPFQVNPPAQFLNTVGGFAPIHRIEREGAVVRVDGRIALSSVTVPSGFGAATFDQGDVVADFLAHGRLPARARVADSLGRASGALSYALDLAPGASREVAVVVPLHGIVPEPLRPPATGRAALSAGEQRRRTAADLLFMKSREAWDSPTEPHIDLPDREVAHALQAQVRWILINQDSAGIQPGSRAYERSWIRDGALTSAALLRMGHPEAVRAFMEWFASYQYPDGKVPCCVDRRGADPVPEHDSHGELIWLVAEYYRYTADTTAVRRLWPAVAKAAAYLDTLRATRRTAEWRARDRRPFFGLLPPSISHEGYSAKPMHSYWDDFFALRGYDDAVFLAGVLGRPERARLTASRDQFARDLGASVRAAMAAHRIDYVPGCADLGDFDATSTTIALAPTGAERVLPRRALERTFERYWEFFRKRRDGVEPWEAFTPYEIRTIGAFARLGWRDRANELLRFFMDHRWPPGWEQWSEVVWRDARTPHFIGDLPHTWVGSDFVRSVIDLLAYDRESDRALVVAAGVPWSWASEGDGVWVHHLPTPHGTLSYHLKARGDSLGVTIDQGLTVPPGGIVLLPPARRPFRSATVNGVAAALTRERGVVVRKVPATVVLRP